MRCKASSFMTMCCVLHCSVPLPLAKRLRIKCYQLEVGACFTSQMEEASCNFQLQHEQLPQQSTCMLFDLEGLHLSSEDEEQDTSEEADGGREDEKLSAPLKCVGLTCHRI